MLFDHIQSYTGLGLANGLFKNSRCYAVQMPSEYKSCRRINNEPNISRDIVLCELCEFVVVNSEVGFSCAQVNTKQRFSRLKVGLRDVVFILKTPSAESGFINLRRLICGTYNNYTILSTVIKLCKEFIYFAGLAHCRMLTPILDHGLDLIEE